MMIVFKEDSLWRRAIALSRHIPIGHVLGMMDVPELLATQLSFLCLELPYKHIYTLLKPRIVHAGAFRCQTDANIELTIDTNEAHPPANQAIIHHSTAANNK